MSTTNPIRHVVVLMMENHSFDHMIGWLPGIGELDGSQYNQDTNGNSYPVTEGADYRCGKIPRRSRRNWTASSDDCSSSCLRTAGESPG